MIVLDDGRGRAQVYPEMGAAIGRYDWLGAGGDVLPVFETAPSADRAGPYALGMNLLVPFSNRISGGGFTHEGTFHALERNTAGPYPIHGNGFMLEWRAREVSATRAVLTVESEGPGPFRYEAYVSYSLTEGALTTRLAVTNRAAISLPYGAGLHPWFVRTPQTQLTLSAVGYWTETADHLPASFVPLAGDSRFDFAGERRLPETSFNTAITGWTGRATLVWPERGLAADIIASPPLTTVILCSPAGAGYVCVEPVSHSVDAHNRSEPGTEPPQVLEPGDMLVAEATIRPFVLR
jgi:aldose 1-epimerase